jgi:hypothetical protein
LYHLRADAGVAGPVVQRAHIRLPALLLALPSDVAADDPRRKDDEGQRRNAANGDADYGACR